MTSFDVGALAIAVLVSVLLVVAGFVAGRLGRDRIFAGLTPGLVPTAGQQAAVVRVSPGREYSGEVPVAFAPPRGLPPALIGTLVDGKAEMRDLTATVVDLAARGWVRIEVVDVAEGQQRSRGQKARDWMVTPLPGRPSGERLTTFERALLKSLTGMVSGPQGGVLMSVWTRMRAQDLRAVRDDLYAQSVTRGWYDKDPRPKGRGCLVVLGWVALIGWNLMMLAVSLTVGPVLGGVVTIAAAVFATRQMKRRVPRTAVGTAIRIEALGFKKYLATAEADQFSFEEAAGIFSRYLPYALVFGVAQHWSKVFGEVARRSQLAGGPDVVDDLLWLDMGLDVAHSLALFADGFGGFLEVADLLDGVGAITEGIGGFVGGVGEVISDLDLDLDF